jgi:hypothetical protein
VSIVAPIPSITVEPITILSWHGYKDLSKVPEQIVLEAERVAGEVGNFLSPGACFRLFRIDSVADGVVALEGGWTFKGRILARLVRDATDAALFVATIGETLEERASALFEEGDFLASVLLDAAGTVALHRVVKALRLTLAREAEAMGHQLTGRTAPGYGDWDLRDQAQLFQALSGDPLPVRLSESGVMIPKKSLSGLIGFVPVTRPAR